MKKLILLSFLIVAGFITNAQVTTSNISGVVYDNANQLLPGANIKAVHTPTGTTYGGITNFDGRFSLVNLRVGGPYRITISYVGFKKQLVDDVYLQLGQTFNLDVVMVEEDNQLEEVVITSNKSSTFGSERTGAETSVGRRELKSLPTISRSAQDFTRLEPTASGNSFGGRNDQFNNFSLDGSIFNNPFGLDAATPGGQTNAQPISLDAIDQIQVSTAPYDVTQSGFTGAAVNAVTKSGTNEFKGTAYTFYRDDNLTGSKVKGDDIFVPELEQTQFGFSIGGPIIKNKLFFFANFEKDQRTDLGFPWVANNGDGVQGINESRVLESDLIRVQDALRGLGYEPGTFEGYLHESNSTKGILKLDWNINEDHRLAFIYNFLDASQEKPAHPTALGIRGPNSQVIQFQNSGYEINNRINSFLLEVNSTFGDNAANKFQVGYTFFDDFRTPFSTPAPSITIQDGAGSNYIIAGHEPFSINNKLEQRVIQATNNFNYFIGRHTITAGASFEMFRFKNSFNLGVYGGTFGWDLDNNPDTPNTQFASVDEFLTFAQPGGLVDNTIQAAVQTFNNNNQFGEGDPNGWQLAETNVGQFALYAQDKWEVTDDFNLTLGIRFDKPLYFDTDEKIQENIDRKGTYVPDIDYFNPETGETVRLSSTTLPSNDFLISPRLGFNWDVKGETKTQIRGGTGIFTGRFPFVWLGNQVQGVDVFFYQIVDPDFKWPQVWRTNIGADHRFENGIILTGDISYTKDINAAHVQNWGLRNPSETLAGVDNRPVYAASDKGNNAYVFTNSDKGRIWNATIKAQKTFENGLYASIAYNYLNSKDVNSIEAEITGDAFDFNAISGNANDDVLSYSRYGDTHRIIGIATKNWTYGKNKQWGTTVSGFFEYAQGGRFNYLYAGNINNDSSFQNNDLLYIPTSAEIEQMNFDESRGVSEAAQREALEAYIQQDDYLSDNRGEYAERYAALAPWRSRVDLKLLQDFNFQLANGKTNTIQFSLDILNFGNFINSDWGVIQEPRANQLIGVSVDPVTNEPLYSFDPNVTETFTSDSSLQSRWQMQFGLRYIFN
ncbi:carboxypeptidase regulatory-like domain-containing protein [Aquimarina gracilis]|uniref:Carboxypeptidase regulatory-like domain-containing protein n=1 Tax=Aquimarina gracilis TaxID=874422 RepID=A0ABU6A2B3_9FLAO|nr:carboxypeptidase regulatory-like domain-containing protein [Aquimarina gracilis]MEB3348281.1 carboxypeptidase regulatory-like domain-containing protein [Aquimarina gracilis]